jgi:hypothetical protein
MNPSLANLTDNSVLVFGGISQTVTQYADGRIEAAAQPTTGTAVFDEQTLRWRETAPLPEDFATPSTQFFGVVGGDGYVWTRATHLAGESKDTILRYRAAADRWDQFPPPPVAADQLIAAGTNLIALDERDDHPGQGPSGAVLDQTGTWHLLPPDPFAGHPFYNPGFNAYFRTHHNGKHPPREFDWFRSGVWTGGRLLLTAGPAFTGPHIEVAALDISSIGEPGAAWSMLPEVSDPDGAGAQAPVWVAGRLVWTTVVYDLATGTSRPLPDAVREQIKARQHHWADSIPEDTVVIGNRVVLGGLLVDPDTLGWAPFPSEPMEQRAPANGFGAVGGPRGYLHFGGAQSAGDGARYATGDNQKRVYRDVATAGFLRNNG